jgi:S1-C subfamily serine protease
MPLNIPDPTDEDIRRGHVDLAVIETHIPTTCHLNLASAEDFKALRIGQGVIAIGIPGFANSEVLYSGTVSAIFLRPPLPVGSIVDRPGEKATERYNLIELQMPASPGASGSPIISESNKVVGVVSELPIIMPDEVANASKAYNPQRPDNDRSRVADATAWVISQFAAPGLCLAVPTLLLDDLVSQQAKQSIVTPAGSSHQPE